MATVRINGLDDAAARVRHLGANAGRALYTAAKLTAGNTRAETVRRLGGKNGHLFLTARTVRAHTSVRTAGGDTRLIIESKPLPLSAGGGQKASYKAKRLKRGIKMKVRRDKGPETFRHAYIAKGRVMLRPRRGAKRARWMHGPSIARAFDESGILRDLEETYIPRRLNVNLQAQIARFT